MFFGPIDFISRCFFKVLLLIDAIVYHTYVCYDNGKKLFTLLIRGTRTWVIMLFRLVLFTLLLAPGWYKLLRYWFLSPLIIRNLRYGKGAKNRNLLDVYLPVPQKRNKLKGGSGEVTNYNHSYSQKNGAPVVVFVSGGAWTIGYKLWSALVARGLAKLGILTIVPDYRNFPQGDVEDMMEDIRLAVEWTSINAHRFGGDASKIVLSGQSAGAHITLCLLVSDYLQKKLQEQDAKNKTSRRFSRAQAERFLGSTDGSGSIYEDDNDSESDIGSDLSDDEELLDGEEIATPVTLTRSDDVVTEGDDAGLPVMTPVAVTSMPDAGLSPMAVEYTTPLRSHTSNAKLPKSPRASLHSLHTNSTEGEVKSPTGRRSRRPLSSSSSSHKVLASGVNLAEEVDVLNTDCPVTNAVSSSHKKHHSPKHSDEKKRRSSGSIIDLIDTYLGANISSNNHPMHSASGKIISNTASSLKKKFREQVRRTSETLHYEVDHFTQGENSSSEQEEALGPWREVDSVRKSAQKHAFNTPLHHSSNINTPIVVGGMSAMGALSPTPVVSRAPGITSLPQADPLSETPMQDFDANPRNSMKPWGRALPRLPRVRARRIKKKFCVASNIKLFIGVSGPYNLEALESHLHQRGMDARILNWICRGSIGNYSPTTLLAEHANQLLALQHQERVEAHPHSVPIAPQVFSAQQPSAALADLTPIALFHGSRDATIPVSSCLHLSEVLHMHGANALCKIYEGWSHTDAILEAPLSGTMRLFNDMAGVIFAHTAECSSTLSSNNNIDGLPQQPSPLTIPLHLDAQDPADNDNYVCSPLDYVSLFLFPKLFGSGPATSASTTATAPVIVAEPVRVPGDVSTNVSTSGEDVNTRTNEKVRRKVPVGRKNKRADQEKKVNGSDAMVSQLLVKIAREINPF